MNHLSTPSLLDIKCCVKTLNLPNEVIGILDFSNYENKLKLTKEDISKI